MIITVISVWLSMFCLIPIILKDILSYMTDIVESKAFLCIIYVSIVQLIITLFWLLRRTILFKRFKNNLFNIIWICHAIVLTVFYLLITYCRHNIGWDTINAISRVFSSAESCAMILKLYTIVKSRKEYKIRQKQLGEINQNLSGNGTVIDPDKH